MAYDKTQWINDVTPLSAGNLNHIENGLFDLSTAVENLVYTIAHLDESFVTLATEQTIGAKKTITGSEVLLFKHPSLSEDAFNLKITLYDNISSGIEFRSCGSISFIPHVGNSAGYTMSVNEFSPGNNDYSDLGDSSTKWKNLYMSGNISDGTNAVTPEELRVNRVYRTNFAFDDLTIHMVIGWNIGLYSPTDIGSVNIMFLEKTGLLVSITIVKDLHVTKARIKKINLVTMDSVDYLETTAFDTTFNNLTETTTYKGVYLNPNELNEDWSFVQAKYQGGYYTVTANKLNLYRHMIKIESEYGGQRAYLMFEALLTTATPLTVNDYSAILSKAFMSTGNVYDESTGTRTGIMRIYVTSDRHWTGINSAGDNFSWYVQDLIDTVFKIF